MERGWGQERGPRAQQPGEGRHHSASRRGWRVASALAWEGVRSVSECCCPPRRCRSALGGHALETLPTNSGNLCHGQRVSASEMAQCSSWWCPTRSFASIIHARQFGQRPCGLGGGAGLACPFAHLSNCVNPLATGQQPSRSFSYANLPGLTKPLACWA